MRRCGGKIPRGNIHKPRIQVTATGAAHPTPKNTYLTTLILLTVVSDGLVWGVMVYSEGLLRLLRLL